MKLEEITTHVLYVNVHEDFQVSFMYHLNENTFEVRQIPSGSSSGGFVKGLKSVGKLMTNPVVAGLAVAYAEKAYKKYKHNKKYITRFFAKSSFEKPFYEKIISELMKTGHYKKIKHTAVEDGYIWELERTK